MSSAAATTVSQLDILVVLGGSAIGVIQWKVHLKHSKNSEKAVSPLALCRERTEIPAILLSSGEGRTVHPQPNQHNAAHGEFLPSFSSSHFTQPQQFSKSWLSVVVLPSSPWHGPREVLSLLPAGWWRPALPFSKALHILPMPTFLPALQCPHTPPQTTSHPFTLPPASHPSAKSVLLQLPSAKLPLPFLDPSTFCLPQFTAFIMQCSPRPSTHFLCYCYCRTPRQVTVCTAGSSSSTES